MEQPSQSARPKNSEQPLMREQETKPDIAALPDDDDTQPAEPVKEEEISTPSASSTTKDAGVQSAYDEETQQQFDRDDDDTQPRRPKRKFDVVIVKIPPARRMHIVDALMKNTLTTGMTMLEALVLTFQVPSLPMHCVSLKEARALELILEYVGAEVEIRTAKYCADDEEFE